MAKNYKGEPKLVNIFRSLGKEDRRKLGRYIQAPIREKSSRAVLLFNHLKNNTLAPGFDLFSEKIFSKLFLKGEAYDKQKIREVAATLTKLIEDYLVINEALYERRTPLLIAAQKRRNMTKQIYENLNKLLVEVKGKPLDDYFPLIKIHEELYFHPTTHKLKKENADTFLSKAVVQFNRYYFANRLKLYCEQYMRMAVKGVKKQEMKGIDVLIQRSEMPIYQDDKLLQAYRMIANIYYTGKTENYPQLKQFILKHKNEIPTENYNWLFPQLVNVAAFSVKKNKLNEYFEWYVEGQKVDAFLENGFFPKDLFVNFVHVACNLNKYSWAEQFIIENSPKLHSTKKNELENLEQLTKAYISLGKGDYVATARALSTISYEDFAYSLRWHILSLKNIYEEKKQRGYLGILDQGKRFTPYLRRKKKKGQIPESTYDRNLKFYQYLEKLAQYSPSSFSNNPVNLDELKNEIEGTAALVEKRWLLEKIKELQNK